MRTPPGSCPERSTTATPDRVAGPDPLDLLLNPAWWRFYINDLKGVPFYRIEEAIDRISEMEAAGVIAEKPRVYRKVTISTKGYADLSD